MAICMICGKEITRGVMTNLDDFCTHEECFEAGMNNRYGEGNWRPALTFLDDGGGGFYEYRDNKDQKWYATGIFYTEIEDENDDLLDAITYDQDNILDFDPAKMEQGKNLSYLNRILSHNGYTTHI